MSGEITDIFRKFTLQKKIAAVKTHLGRSGAATARFYVRDILLGRIFVGDVNYQSGPDNLRAANSLSAALLREGITLMRFKTGTPPRIRRCTIDFSALTEQPGEEYPLPYSADTPEDSFIGMPQLKCYIVYTTPETHRIIRENLDRSAMYSGQIHGTGTRYCPSIEDKIVRFADKERPTFVGQWATPRDVPSGFSTSHAAIPDAPLLRLLEAEIMAAIRY